jgi:hypothetical protein
MITWNRSRKRNQWGQHQQTARPERDWIEVPAPELRIVSDEEWHAAHARLDRAREEYARATHGQRHQHRDRDSKYLLPGFARWALCNGGLHVRSHSHGNGRAFFYACTSHYNRGPEVSRHVEQWPMLPLDHVVLARIAGDVLKPELLDEIVAAAREMHEASRRPEHRGRELGDLEAIEREQARLTDAIAAGADVPVLVERLKETESKRRQLAALVEQHAKRRQAPPWREIERRVRQSLTEWCSLITGDVAQARQAFRQLLTKADRVHAI